MVELTVNVFSVRVLLVLVLRLDKEGMGTEVISLCLEHVGGKIGGAVSVKEGQSGGESGKRDTPEGRLGHNVAPAFLRLVDSLVKEIVEEQVLEVRVAAVSLGDVFEEDRADDAAATPHESDFRLVEGPVVFLSGILDEHEALGV